MKLIDHKDIPDFDSFEDFCYWYINDGYFICYPENWMLADIGNSYETIIFRHKQYQVEMYFISKGFDIPRHAHHGANTLEIILSPQQKSLKYSNPTTIESIRERIRLSGSPHGGKSSPLMEPQELEGRGGYILVVLQEWCSTEAGRQTFISNRYTGFAMSEQHISNVLETYPDAIIEIKKIDGVEYKWIDTRHCI